MTSVSSQVLWDKSFILPLPSQTMYMQIPFPEINICMKAKDVNEFLVKEFQVKFFFFSSTVVPQLRVCILRSTHFWKSTCKKEFFFPCPPESCISVIYVRRCEIQTSNRRARCIILVPLFQWSEVEAGPKRDSGDWIQLWHRTVLLPCSIPADPLVPALHCGDCEGAPLLFSCPSEVQLPAWQSCKRLRHTPHTTYIEYRCV